MADWSTLANVGTATGTLVLGAATFLSVRSANRATRIAEQSLLIGMRPALAQSRQGDPVLISRWGDGYKVHLPPGRAHVALTDEAIYLAIPLRNSGQGLAVLSGWRLDFGFRLGSLPQRPEREDFRRQQRDLMVPAGDVGFWQSAIRDRTDELWEPVARAIQAREMFLVQLLYGDAEGGQPTIGQFAVYPAVEDQDGNPDPGWRADLGRHWTLDGVDHRVL